MNVAAGPTDIVWDITYACPLRCDHCYSESGRRPARHLGLADALRVADALLSLRPAAIALAGGEPLLMPGLLEVAGRISRAGTRVALYTGGWSMTPGIADDIMTVFDRVVVSVDGATPETHDRIRGRAGSFDRALRTLALLDEAAGLPRPARRRDGRGPGQLGIDCAVVRSNFDELAAFCTGIAPEFPRLRHLQFGAAVPSGLASRAGFADHELVTDAQAAALAGRELTARLRALAPAGVHVGATDNRALQMHPDLVARGAACRAMQVEPDGRVRAMPIYEGTVGSLLTEDPAELWRRAVARWSDPFVVAALAPVRDMRGWAEAARRIDRHFGSGADRARIERRPAFGPQAAARPRDRFAALSA